MGCRSSIPSLSSHLQHREGNPWTVVARSSSPAVPGQEKAPRWRQSQARQELPQWAWEDVNFRHHAYQALWFGPKSRHSAVILTTDHAIYRHLGPIMRYFARINRHQKVIHCGPVLVAAVLADPWTAPHISFAPRSPRLHPASGQHWPRRRTDAPRTPARRRDP